MLRLVGLVVSIGLADSINPTTIAPALYLAGGPNPRRRVLEFVLGVFVVLFAGGALIALGPGQLLLSLVPKPDHEDRQVIQTVAGGGLMVAGVLLWRYRRQLAERELPAPKTEGRSSAILGATITAVELPTAFPYFAVIAAIVGSGFGIVHQLVLLLLFSLCFVLPLLAITVMLTVSGDGAERSLARSREFIERNWPTVLSVLLFCAGVFVFVLGVTALGARTHGRFGRFLHKVNRLLHP